MHGEKIYEYDLAMSGLTEHGLTLADVLTGSAPIPPEGARIEVEVAGTIAGRLSGTVTGADLTVLRADGLIDLDIRATIETEEGVRIALWADGVAVPRPDAPIGDLFEQVLLGTSAPGYEWLHGRQVWGIGTVDFAEGKIHIDGYLQ